MKTKRAVATVRKAAGAAGASAAAQIHAWENDPFAQATPTNPPVQATPIARPVPNLGSTPLAIGISSPQPPPQVYNTGTPEFRYWAATEALGRGRDFWRGILPAGTNWHTTVGPKLIVNLDNGVDLNAYYDRHNLDFFHGSAGGMTVYSGESPDVVCHELGHATLDALKPALFNAGFIETAAFHESFGDMSALLSALQTTQMRHDVLAETHGHLARSSSLSRLAEQLGWAIRQSSPSAVDPNCLRNAANSLFYRDPSTLPPSAPASSLSSEPHSFSRVFTGAFLDALAGMLHVVAHGRRPTEAELHAVSKKAADYLIGAIENATVVPTFYSQVAAAMVHRAHPTDKHAVVGGFVQHGILSLPAAASAIAGTARVAAAAAAAPVSTKPSLDLEDVTIDGAQYGFGTQTLLVHGMAEGAGFRASAAVLGVGAMPQPAPEQAAKDFLEDLIQLGRIELKVSGTTAGAFALTQSKSSRLKTHEIVKEGTSLRLRRVRFDCGFDCGCGGH